MFIFLWMEKINVTMETFSAYYARRKLNLWCGFCLCCPSLPSVCLIYFIPLDCWVNRHSHCPDSVTAAVRKKNVSEFMEISFFPIVRIRWWKLSPRIMSPSLICLLVLLQFYVRCGIHMKFIGSGRNPTPSNLQSYQFFFSWWSFPCRRLWVTQDCLHSPLFLPSFCSFSSCTASHFSLLCSLPYPKFRILWCAFTLSSFLPFWIF